MELYLNKIPVTYDEAKAGCKAMNSSLVEIWHEDEFEEVKLYIWKVSV